MSTTPNLLIELIASNQASKEITANAAFNDLDGALTGLFNHALTDADYTVATDTALYNLVFVFTGTLTADRHIILPTNKKLYIVSNQTSGGYNLIFEVPVLSPPGNSVSLPNVYSGSPAVPAAYKILYCDGTNIVQVG